MEIIVTFRHLDPNESLKQYAREKLSRVEKYDANIGEVHVILEVEKRSFVAEAVINLNKSQITAREVNEDNMYTAIDLMADKVERQIKKHREKHRKDHQRKARYRVLSTEFTDVSRPSVVRSDSMAIGIVSVEDAVRQLAGADDDFYVFKNAESGKVSVLYRRSDGDYGLIEPEND